MKKPKLGYVTREAQRWIAGPHTEDTRDVERLIRRVLQRAEKVCDDIAFEHMGARWTVAMQCRDAIKALRVPGKVAR